MTQRLENVCEEKIFRELFRRLSRDLHNFLYYKYGAAHNPADLVQEAFAKLWVNCKNVPLEKAKSYLFTVANNQMLNELDKKKTVLNYQNTVMVKSYTHESPEYQLEESEYMDRLQKVLEDLTEDQRVTFLLNRVEGKKHQEIADMLGISRKAVEKRIYTALNILQQKLGKL